VNVVRLRDLLDRLDALQRLQGHPGLEFSGVPSSFCFHSVLVWFDLIPTQHNHNHSLTFGPISGVRLSPPPPEFGTPAQKQLEAAHDRQRELINSGAQVPDKYVNEDGIYSILPQQSWSWPNGRPGS